MNNGSGSSRTRVGVIGVGGIGSSYAEAVASSTELECTAVADSDPVRAEQIAGAVGAQWYLGADELITKGTCDLVIVATPPNMHEQHVISAVGAGLDVLCEKPFAIGLDSAVRMFEHAHDASRMLGMASKFRYVDDLRRARTMIDEGRIGAPLAIDVLFASSIDMSQRWNSVRGIAGGGVLIDNGTHAVDIVRYLVGGIRRVSAMCTSSEDPDQVEDTAVLLAETVSGAIATMTVSWATAPIGGSYVTVYGTDGSIDVGWKGSRVRASSDEWVPFGSGYSKLDALRMNVESIAAARNGRAPMRNTVADVLASVSVIESAYRAISSHAWVETPDHDALAARLDTVEMPAIVSS